MKKVLVKATRFFVSPVHGNVQEGDQIEVSESLAAHLLEHKQAVRVDGNGKVQTASALDQEAATETKKPGLLDRITGKNGKANK